MTGVLSGGEVFDLQVNRSDLDWFRWIFDALDGQKTASLDSPRKASEKGSDG